MAVIERKVAGEKPEPAQRAEPTNITDLMAALEASVAAARQDRRTAKAEKADEGEAADEAKAAVATKAPPKRRRKTA
jgi:non-homologous end joining protein Ku